MISWAEIEDIYCRQTVDPRAAEFCRAAYAQHSPAVAVFLHSIPKFWRREGKREKIIKDHKFQMSGWIFRYNLSLHEGFWEFLFTSKNSTTDLVSVNISVAGRLLVLCSHPSLLFCLFLFTRPDQEYTVFLAACRTQSRIKCRFSWQYVSSLWQCDQ